MSPRPIGALRHRLTLETPVHTSDSAGGMIETWTTVTELWGAIETRGGSETLDVGGIKGRLTHDIVVRARDDLAPRQRFRHSVRIFEIIMIRPLDTPTSQLICSCIERNL